MAARSRGRLRAVLVALLLVGISATTQAALVASVPRPTSVAVEQQDALGVLAGMEAAARMAAAAAALFVVLLAAPVHQAGIPEVVLVQGKLGSHLHL